MSDAHLTPYDKGTRAEPIAWSTENADALGAMAPIERELAEDRYGKVDFDDDSGMTIATVWIERADDGTQILRVQQFADEVLIQVRS